METLDLNTTAPLPVLSRGQALKELFRSRARYINNEKPDPEILPEPEED